MVVPLLAPAIIGAAGALGSAGLGAIVSGNAADTNAAIAGRNIQSTERENFLQRIMANRLLDLQLQPTTDAFGNRAEFIPGVGFTTTPAPAVKTLQDASIREQTQQLTTDAGRQREGRGRAAELGRRESGTANQLLSEFLRIVSNPQDANELFQLLLGSGQQAFQGEQDRQLQQVLRQNLRSGGSAESGGNIIAKFASQGAGQRRDAAVDARLKSITGADQINQSREGNAANLFNLFAQRAQNSFGNVAFQPEQISAQASTLGTGQRGNVLGASQLAALLSRGTPAQGAFLPADQSLSKLIGGAGNALSELFKTLGQQNPETQTGPDIFGNSFDDRRLPNAQTDPRIRP